MAQPPTPASEPTRAALIAAALHLFGAKGFAATSTREIAARVGTNIASIAYHFGGKEGLRLACAAEFSRRLGFVIAEGANGTVTDPKAARDELRARFQRMIQFMLGNPDSTDLSAFMLREVTENGPGVDEIYTSFLQPTHIGLCRLWALACGGAAESVEVRLSVFSFLGQILYFRFGAPFVRRRMDWPAIGPAELGRISTTLIANLDALIGATVKA